MKKIEYKKYLLKESKKIYNARKSSIDFFDKCTSRISETKHQAKRATELKTLAFKQMLQRLPIALALVEAGNNSENLLNEIRQIVYSLYQSKKIIKTRISSTE